MKQNTIFIPENFNPKKWGNVGEGISLFLHEIYIRQYRYVNGTYKQQMAPVSSQHMESMMSSNKYVKVRQTAIDNALVETDHIYNSPTKFNDSHSKVWALGFMFENVDFKSYELKDKNIIRKRNKYLENCRKIREKNYLPIHFKLKSDIRKLKLDYLSDDYVYEIAVKCAHDNHESPTQKNINDTYRSLNINNKKLWNKHFFHELDKAGRFHTNVTNLQKDIRTHLSYKGKRLKWWDVSNSQLLFMSWIVRHMFKFELNYSTNNKYFTEYQELLGKTNTKIDLRYIDNKFQDLDIIIKEINRFQKECESGLFYDNAIRWFKNDPEYNLPYDQQRKLVKTNLLAVLFDNIKKTKYQYYYRKQYPNIYILINHIKKLNQKSQKGKGKSGYTHWYLLLQQLESDTLIVDACTQFKNKTNAPIYTLHDGLATIEPYTKTLYECVYDSISSLGLSPTIKVE